MNFSMQSSRHVGFLGLPLKFSTVTGPKDFLSETGVSVRTCTLSASSFRRFPFTISGSNESKNIYLSMSAEAMVYGILNCPYKTADSTNGL